ncbi:filamentous hemagglutinin family domain-containing protein [Candidatus Bartonella washoeensis Sb944nv]|uniref:Filamentous hemagglutinin family domain-containing protein n=1 Tax=Candidatus Bartonella washoeensis Sb944nv TaxID=1094563 RepID=J0QFX1_9HYPH|nr:hemagglutinin repeat-containing protein [Bartonella washoeensis]EJF81739.1 filamentous hemagglutinin family domain-containing protein [Bartonella washoeensis Sb944nv]
MRYEKKANRENLLSVLVSSTMLKKVLFGGFGLSFLLQPLAVQAQISVDSNAGAVHQPDIVAAPNGVPSIDIVTPNGKGLSHNKYHDFNIDNPGVILNNHAQEVGQSQLGGIMPGNPHLHYSGSAKVILNEVTSGKRSALNGPAEVFGHQADVIIANPNGISCDGCGFINTPHATLTTGVPEIDASGFLKGFEVKGGDMTFGAKGANFFSGKGSVDIVDIVSRTVHFEGVVAGREIGVTAGTGHFDYASREMKELTDITGKPEYAIDGSALGALQADRIKLVATEKGVGVRMRHDMATNAGQLQLSADGKLSLKNVFGHGGVVLKSKSQSVLAKNITSKKNIEITAKKDVTLQTVAADSHVKIEVQDGLLSIAGNATSGGNMELSSRQTLKVSGLGSGADMALEAGGDLKIEGIVLAQGNLKAHASGDIQAQLLAGGVDMAATGAIGVVVLGTKGDVDLQSSQGAIVAESVYGAGDITLVSHNGLSVSQTILSHQNIAIHAQPNTNTSVHFGQLLANGDANIKGGAVDFTSLITRGDTILTVGSLDAGTLITGIVEGGEIGDLVLDENGSLFITAQEGIKVKQIVSGGNIELLAGNDIYYDHVMGYGTATLTSVSGGISIEHELSVRGDVRLTATTLDLSNDRSHIHTPQTLFLKGDTIDISGSTLIYGGLDFNSIKALEIRHALLRAITQEDGTGDILFIAPSVMADKDTSVLAARDFVIKAGALENSGQLASGQDLVFTVTGDVTNNKTGLIYAGGSGALKVDGTVLNDFAAILAEGDLFFVNAQGTGKSLSLVNKAGLIQAGGTLAIQTKSLKNQADSTPEIIKTSQNATISFQKPERFDSIENAILYHTTSVVHDFGIKEKWGVSYKEVECSGDTCDLHIKNFLPNKEATYGKITLKDAVMYKTFTWKESENLLFYQGYRWNNLSHMTEKTVTEAFSHKPTIQGMIQSSGNLIINADTIDNHYSIIRVEGNADIHANVLSNLGATAYKNTFMGCNANTDYYCYAYNADGSRNVALDIASNGALRHISSEIADTVSGLVQAGGTLNLVVETLNNMAAEGSITGDAHFKAQAVGGDPLGALSGLTAAGALFTPNIAIDGTAGVSDGSSLPLPKPQSGGVGGTLPKQNFLYETRAQFLDVGKFYGSAYYLNRIGYNPNREIFFLGDAYFEKQLIEKQLRDLVGQGLGKGSFIPGSDAIEQVKTLLDKGAEYVRAHNLPFGDALSEEQLASLEAPMVIYVRQQVKGMDVYAPVLYIPKKDRASFVSSGALIMGRDVNITSQNTSNSTITNSGLVEASHQLHIKGCNILNQGGHLASGDNIVLVADNNIRFEAGHATVESVKTALKTGAISASGNAVVIAKQDVTASGVCITTRGVLALSAEQGTLSVGAAAITNRMGQRVSVIQHQTEVNSGNLVVLLAGKDLNVVNSRVQAHDTLHLKAARNVSIDAIHNNMNHHVHGETSHLALHKGSYLSSGKGIAVSSGRDIHVAASSVDAKGNIVFGAQGEVTISAKKDQMEYHLQSQNTTIDRHVSAFLGASIKAGGDISMIAGQDGKQHDLSIIGSSVAADGNVGLKASNDILITNTENSLQRKISGFAGGGVFGGGKSVHNNVESTQVVSANITGDEGITIESGKDTQVIESILIANIADETKDQVKANILLKSGRNITIKGGQERFKQQEKLTKKAFLTEKSSNKSQEHTTTISSNLGAEGNIVIKAKNETIISGSQMFTGKDIALIGENVFIDGMKDYHNTYLQEHKSDFGIGSGSGFVSIWGKKSKTQTDESVEHKGSSLGAGGNINIAAKKSNVTMVGSDFAANKDITLFAVRDVNVKDGYGNYTSNMQEKQSAFGIQVTKNHNGTSIGIGLTSSKDKANQEGSSSVQSHFIAGRDIQINTDHNVHLQAADIVADRDVKIDAGNDVTLSESHNISNGKEMHDKSFAGITTSANAGIVGTLQEMGDAVQHFGHGDGKHKIGKIGKIGLKGYDLYNQSKNLYNGMKGKATKDNLFNTANVSANVTAGFKSDKTEAFFNTSMAVTDKIEAGRAVRIEAKKGTLHDVGADIIAGKISAYTPNNDECNNEHSGEMILKAGQDINLEGIQNVQSSNGKTQSSSLNIGYSYGIDGRGWTGNTSFSQGKDSSEEVQHKNSHVIGKGNIDITSEADTSLEGAAVSGKGIKADVGGNFTIASRSDSGKTSKKQKSLSVGYGGEKIANPGSINFSLQQDKSSSHYNSVVEQSGIKAGEQGFDIAVTGKTILTGGIIDSTASVDKNTLTNASIATEDIANSAQAESTSDGISIAVGGALQEGKYGIAKNVAKNALDHGKAYDSAKGQTKSTVSSGTIIIKDEARQKASTGKGAEETIDALNRDTAEAHQGIERLDVAKLERIARANRQMKTQFLEKAFKYSDEAYKTMFIKEHPIAVINHDEKRRIIYLTDKKGQLSPQYHYLTPDEKQHLQVGSDGKVHVSINGIFNSANGAARYALQHADNKNEPHYFIYFPKSNSVVSELLIAGYQKFMENNFFGLSNSTKKVRNLIIHHGNHGLHFDAYSRGGMTVGNALQSLNEKGMYGIAGKTTINLFAPAYNAQVIADTLDKLSGGKQTSVGLENHKYDFVGSWIGDNPATFDKVPPGSNRLKEAFEMMMDSITVHSCLGSGKPGCKKLYGTPHRVRIPSGKGK